MSPGAPRQMKGSRPDASGELGPQGRPGLTAAPGPPAWGVGSGGSLRNLPCAASLGATARLPPISERI